MTVLKNNIEFLSKIFTTMTVMKDKYPFRVSNDGTKVLKFGINMDTSADFKLVNDELDITVISRSYAKNNKKIKNEWGVHFKGDAIHINFTLKSPEFADYSGTIDIENGEVVKAVYINNLNENEPIGTVHQKLIIAPLVHKLDLKLSNVDAHILKAYTQKFFKNEVTLPNEIVDTINSYIP